MADALHCAGNRPPKETDTSPNALRLRGIAIRRFLSLGSGGENNRRKQKRRIGFVAEWCLFSCRKDGWYFLS